MRDTTHRLGYSEPPEPDLLPFINASADVVRWLEHYWNKLRLPASEALRLAVTDDRKDFHRWTGRRLNPLALGCYCYLPTLLTSDGSSRSTMQAPAAGLGRTQMTLPGFNDDTTGDKDKRTLEVAEPPKQVE